MPPLVVLKPVTKPVSPTNLVTDVDVTHSVVVIVDNVQLQKLGIFQLLCCFLKHKLCFHYPFDDIVAHQKEMNWLGAVNTNGAHAWTNCISLDLCCLCCDMDLELLVLVLLLFLKHTLRNASATFLCHPVAQHLVRMLIGLTKKC